MILPKGLKRTFWDELKTYAEDRKMPYITSVEEIGYDRGLEQGERSYPISSTLNPQIQTFERSHNRMYQYSFNNPIRIVE